MRQLQSKFFNSVACVLTHVVASDTQCGFKAFRTEPGKLLFHLTEGKGFAFDVEVLALAQLLDLRIVEVPIHWVDVSGSSVRAVRDPFLMLRDILRTRRRCRSIERKLGRRVQESVRPLHGIDAQLRELLQVEDRQRAIDFVRDDETANGHHGAAEGSSNGVEVPANGRRTAQSGLA
jgi:hypothetical protein